jgi:hypothetical protein
MRKTNKATNVAHIDPFSFEERQTNVEHRIGTRSDNWQIRKRESTNRRFSCHNNWTRDATAEEREEEEEEEEDVIMLDLNS